MDIKLEAEGLESTQRKLQSNLDLYQRGLKIEMWRAVRLLEAAAKQNVRRRSGLNVRTGALLNSIQSDVKEEDGEIVGYVGSYGVPYAAVHEFGHNFPARMVLPRFANALSWVGPDGRRAFSKGHMVGPYRVPARPFIRPAFDENKDMIYDRFRIFMVESFTLED